MTLLDTFSARIYTKILENLVFEGTGSIARDNP